MPHCNVCNPNCHMCHRKAAIKMPVPCPVCGRYNPYEQKTCKRCGAEMPPPADTNKAAKTAVKGTPMCFRCDPLNQPLCKQCQSLGRTVQCPGCGIFNLPARKKCRICGTPMPSPPQPSPK